MVAAALPKTIDLAIVGAGPQALTLVTHLLKKKQSMRNRFVVLDPSGQWLQQWQHQFAAYEIPHLPALIKTKGIDHRLATTTMSRNAS